MAIVLLTGDVPRLVSGVRWRELLPGHALSVQGLAVLPFSVKHGEDLDRCG